MKINSIGIIGGTGGLGARMAEFFEHKFPGLEVLVSGRSTEVTNKKIVQECDLVIFGIPIGRTLDAIAGCITDSRPDQIWADITSIKEGPVQRMLESKAEVCGLHPLFGPLPVIDGQPLIYCPARISDDSLKHLLELLQDFDLVEMTPTEHDEVMGVVQCASHLSDFVMGETLRASGLDFETIWRVSSPAYRSKLQIIGRMFAQNPDLYIDIATLNDHGPRFTATFQKSLEILRDLIDAGDREQLINHFKEIQDYLTSEFCHESYNASQQFMSLSSSTELVAETGKVAVFGQKYSHTDEAVANFFPEKADISYFSQIETAFQAVNEGRFEVAIVPYENSTHGSVLDTLDALWQFPELQIVESRQVAIKQHLLGLSGAKLENIETVTSHPQALAQSREKLNTLLPGVRKIPARSTALAAQALLTQQDIRQGVIGSSMLSQGLGLKVLASDLQALNNQTRFICVGKQLAGVDQKYLSLVFWFRSDRAGNLASVLQFMADRGVNLIKLDSRRTSTENGQYLFFVDAEISIERFKEFEPEFRNLVSGLRVLGGFDY